MTPTRKAEILWLLVGVTILTLVIHVVVARYRQAAPQPLPALDESSKLVVVRVYANTTPQDSFLLVSADGFVCYVEENAWLQSVVNAPTTCLWRKI